MFICRPKWSNSSAAARLMSATPMVQLHRWWLFSRVYVSRGHFPGQCRCLRSAIFLFSPRFHTFGRPFGGTDKVQRNEPKARNASASRVRREKQKRASVVGGAFDFLVRFAETGPGVGRADVWSAHASLSCGKYAINRSLKICCLASLLRSARLLHAQALGSALVVRRSLSNPR